MGKRNLKLETTILPSPRVDKHLAKGSLLQGDYFSESSVFTIGVEVQNPLKNEIITSMYSSISIYCKYVKHKENLV